jgi:hypothetical protein
MTFQMCKYVALCEEVGLSPESQPAVRSHPKPSNPCVLNTPSNYVSEPRTPVDNVNLQGAGAGAATPINVSPQAPLNSTFQVAGTATPVHAQGAGSRAVVKVSPRGARPNDEWPICKCTAGKCKVLEVNGEDCYVCPIPKVMFPMVNTKYCSAFLFLFKWFSASWCYYLIVVGYSFLY